MQLAHILCKTPIMNFKKQFLFIISFLALMSACSHTTQYKVMSKESQLQLYKITSPSAWGVTSSGEKIYAGGFSGLYYTGKSKDGNNQFLTVTDRGPNGLPSTSSEVKENSRTFLLPDFQPRILKIESNEKTKTFSIVQEILLTDPNGKPLNGRPLEPDQMGVDTEGITIDNEGNYWLCEEYHPSLLKFSPDGHLLKRFIPKNSLPESFISNLNKSYKQDVIVARLPEEYKFRKANRGFEGLTFTKNKIYAILQSPIKIHGHKEKKVIPMLEFDTRTETVTRKFQYPLNHLGTDKIGDITYLPFLKSFLVIEQNSKIGNDGLHMILQFKLNDDKVTHTEDLLKPTLVLVLDKVGYNFAEKVEGLTVIDSQHLAVINDNDFGVTTDHEKTGRSTPLDLNKKTILGIINIEHILDAK